MFSKKEDKPLVINNSIRFGYEYWIEIEGEMKKVADSRSLMIERYINEDNYRRQFLNDIKEGRIKGYVDHCDHN